MKATRKIERVRVLRAVDCDADLSTLGEYTDAYDEDAILVSAGEYVKDLPCQDCDKLREEHQQTATIAHVADCENPDDCDCEGADVCEDWNPEIPERGREFRFFRPFSGGETPPNADYYTSGMQDFQRAQDYSRNEWCYTGIRAVADIRVNGVHQQVSSGGLWGVESDSEESYFAEIASEETAQLRDILRGLGFSKRQVDTALTNVETVDA